MAQRFHPVVENASDDYTFVPVIDGPAEVVENMRGRPTTARSELDMNGPDAGCEVVSLTRARTFRIFRDHLDRALDQLAVPPALQSPELAPRFS
jgi:hypothetical protein